MDVRSLGDDFIKGPYFREAVKRGFLQAILLAHPMERAKFLDREVLTPEDRLVLQEFVSACDKANHALDVLVEDAIQNIAPALEQLTDMGDQMEGFVPALESAAKNLDASAIAKAWDAFTNEKKEAEIEDAFCTRGIP